MVWKSDAGRVGSANLRAAGGNRQAAFGEVERDLGAFGKLAHDVEQRLGRRGDRAGLLDLGLGRVRRLDVEVGGGEAQPVAFGLQQDVGQDRNGVPPLDHGLNVGQRTHQGIAVDGQFHSPNPVSGAPRKSGQRLAVRRKASARLWRAGRKISDCGARDLRPARRPCRAFRELISHDASPGLRIRAGQQALQSALLRGSAMMRCSSWRSSSAMRLVRGDHRRDLAIGEKHGGVVPIAEHPPDLGVGALGQLAAEIHRVLARQGVLALAAGGFQIGLGDAIGPGRDVLDRVDAWARGPASRPSAAGSISRPPRGRAAFRPAPCRNRRCGRRRRARGPKPAGGRPEGRSILR